MQRGRLQIACQHVQGDMLHRSISCYHVQEHAGRYVAQVDCMLSCAGACRAICCIGRLHIIMCGNMQGDMLHRSIACYHVRERAGRYVAQVDCISTSAGVGSWGTFRFNDILITLIIIFIEKLIQIEVARKICVGQTRSILWLRQRRIMVHGIILKYNQHWNKKNDNNELCNNHET